MSFLKPGRVMTIDPASHSYAYCIAEYEKIVAFGKVEFAKDDTFSDKLRKIDITLPKIIKRYRPNKVVIEQTVLIQNPKTTRILSYFVGYLWGKSVESGASDVSDIMPLSWKPKIGYKNVTKKDIAQWTKELGKTDANKKAAFERKERIKRIVDEMVPNHGCTDYDIIDAIGIALWATKNIL